MRKLLLNLADKIYSKYGFPSIDMYSKVLYKKDLYKVIDIKLEVNEQKMETLTVVSRPTMSLTEYLCNRKEID